MSIPLRICIVGEHNDFFRRVVENINKKSGDVLSELISFSGAVEGLARQRYDAVVLDADLPVSFSSMLEKVSSVTPGPIIIVSTDRGHMLDALRLGTSNYVLKPQSLSPDEAERFAADLVKRVKAAIFISSTVPANPDIQRVTAEPKEGFAFSGIIALGASTGGTTATAEILKILPENIPGMVIVQHMPPGFTKMYAESLNEICAMTVREAKDGDIITPGLVLVAPGDRQMEVVKKGSGYAVRCYYGEKVRGHCPSVDVLFKSVAKNVPGSNMIGIILTGMGADGAEGIVEMRKKGAFTIGQDEQSSVVYGMPKEAYRMGGIVKQCPLKDIAPVLMEYVRTHKHT